VARPPVRNTATPILVTIHQGPTLRDCPYLEYNVTANPLRTDLLVEPLRPVKGTIDVPQRPELGIELDEDTLETVPGCVNPGSPAVEFPSDDAHALAP